MEAVGTIRRTRGSFLRQGLLAPDSRPQTAPLSRRIMVMLALLGNEQSANTRLTRRRSAPSASVVSVPQDKRIRAPGGHEGARGLDTGHSIRE